MCLLLLPALANANDRYWIFFSDKDGVEFDPHAYFDAKAIERRQRHGLPLDHYTDRPVRDDYLDGVEQIVDSVRLVSRWFNAVVCDASVQQVDKLRSLPFVSSIEQTYSNVQLSGLALVDTTPITPSNERLLRAQTDRMNGQAFREHGIDGTGVRVAIFDAGFPGVDTHPAFEHIRARNGIKATYDFLKKKENPYHGNSHGTAVLSCVAGMYNDIPIGLATGAEFLLARTEGWRENFAEEEHWLAAAEWADKNGADIINSSLGYTIQRYFPEQMDGRTSFVTRAANMAAGKGILVVNAAGNEGDDVDWKFIGAPADADSVLAIGGINPWTGIHTSFSSIGPTKDGRLKPNICAYGHAFVAGPKGYRTTQGTSFSSPLTAGFAACALQVKPELQNMELFVALQQSGDLYPYYDYAHGYGVPQANWWTGDTTTSEAKYQFEKNSVQLKVVATPDAEVLEQIRKETESKEFQQNHCYTSWPTGYFFYQVLDPDTKHPLVYYVVKIEDDVMLLAKIREDGTLSIVDQRPAGAKMIFKPIHYSGILRVHWQGHTQEYQRGS